MSGISNIGGVLDHLDIGSKNKDAPKSNELGQAQFLELLMVKMQNQDPLNPQEDTEFIAELAQFSELEEMEKLNTNFSSFSNVMMSNQALQASSLVGRSVTVPTNNASLAAGNVVSGSVTIPASTSDVNVNIYSESGSLVESIPVGYQSKGEMVFRWDGMYLEVNGELTDWASQLPNGAAPGQYKFEVMASIDGEPTQLDTALSANVNSVTIGSNGSLTLNLAGIGPVSMSDVKQFN
ncbi:flagellar hook assembly protein FlgD [Simiduia sp. 21SJ11W-1]|uniref:flagellar hook assembly protein FlgD n=1 Tax=Simiduia sp. 21SJ11W-1 TaxID=2909669 RepID=UPI0020A02F86|nr:flagellar hook assembly protein FlgD [Simiduia sp. 21SJ11W-1]UTA49461.1 flagellar hook assembly protein FlgD [Simiduia sp. 21SJ11W-1]